MSKKYLETKNNSLESSVLGVWKTAIEEGEAIRDAAQMTKEVEIDEKHGTHVDPKDRDELDKEADARGGAETAKKMKRHKNQRLDRWQKPLVIKKHTRNFLMLH